MPSLKLQSKQQHMLHNSFERVDSWHCHAIKSKEQKKTVDSYNVMFERTLELIQDISVIICKGSPVHTQYFGDCHKCRLYCQKCYRSGGAHPKVPFEVLFQPCFLCLTPPVEIQVYSRIPLERPCYAVSNDGSIAVAIIDFSICSH